MPWQHNSYHIGPNDAGHSAFICGAAHRDVDTKTLNSGLFFELSITAHNKASGLRYLQILSCKLNLNVLPDTTNKRNNTHARG